MRYSIRALFVVMTLCAVAVVVATVRRTGMPIVNAMLMVLGLSLVASCFFAVLAWRLLRSRSLDQPDDGASLRREKIAFASGLTGIIPYAAFWAMGMLDQFESSHRGVHEAMIALQYIAVGCWLPVMLLLLVSLFLLFGARKNAPLLALRIIGLVANVAWPIVTYYFILPHLG